VTDPVVAAVLFAVVSTMAAVSASVGPAGGVVFATMAVTLPAPVVVPVHAAVQVGGSSVRLALVGRFASAPAVAAFVVGGTLGFVPAAVMASSVDLPVDLVRCGLGLATLVPVLVARPASRHQTTESGRSRRRYRQAGSVAVLGTWTSFLALHVGATGAVIGAALAKRFPDPRQRVATHTGCLWFQHLAKIGIHAAMGFSVATYLPLVGLLLIASTLGALVGRRLLTNVSAPVLNAVFDIVILGLGAFLLATGLAAIVVAVPG
jgi:uncharacterized membrane protein YfcA